MLPLLAAGLVGGAIKGIAGLFQKHKGNKILANNPRPNYDIPQEVFQNKGIAEQLSANGLPSTQYAQAQQNIQRQQAGAIQAAQTRRGGLGLIGNIQQRTNDATLGLDATNAKMRVANMQGLMNANSKLAGYRDKAFDINKMQPYIQNYNYAMGLKGAGNANIMSGIDTGLSAFAGGGFGGGLFGGGRRKYNGGNGGQPTYYGDYNGSNTGNETFENGY